MLYTVHGIALARIGLVVAVLSACSQAQPEKPSAELARAMCQQFLEDRAHDPDSFEPIKPWEWRATEQGIWRWSVAGQFRARNGFGALRHHAMVCVVEHTNGRWHLLSLSSEAL